MRICLFIGLLLCLDTLSVAQDTTERVPGVASVQVQRLLPESQWRYIKTIHPESGLTLHEAGDSYQHLVYFQFDYHYQSLLNGEKSRGPWHADGDVLYWNFRQVKTYRIIHISQDRLVLEFEPFRGKGYQQYHFEALPETDSPFTRDKHLLPTVKVDREKSGAATDKNRKKGFFARLWDWIFHDEAPEKEYALTLRVELMGGGFYGGIDPVIKDFITIESNGLLIKEYKSKYQPMVRTEKYIPRNDLEALVNYARQEGFFEWQVYYDCTTALCQRRCRKKPKPIPLQLAITHGDHRKVVMVRMWGKEEGRHRYIDYPPALDEIIRSIHRLAHRIESPS